MQADNNLKRFSEMKKRIGLLVNPVARMGGIFNKPFGGPILDSGFMRVATALPDDNRPIVQSLRALP